MYVSHKLLDFQVDDTAKVEIKQEKSKSAKLESKSAARKPLSGQWTTRKKTPSKSMASDDDDDNDDNDSLHNDQSERKRPPRRKRAWQSVESKPESPCKKRAASEEDRMKGSFTDPPTEVARPRNDLHHVNVGGLIWVQKKAEPVKPITIHDDETGEEIQRAIVEEFVAERKPQSASHQTSAQRRYKGPDFRRFRKNVVCMSVEVIRCGDMLGESVGNNAVMTTLQEMFAGLTD